MCTNIFIGRNESGSQRGGRDEFEDQDPNAPQAGRADAASSWDRGTAKQPTLEFREGGAESRSDESSWGRGTKSNNGGGRSNRKGKRHNRRSRNDRDDNEDEADADDSSSFLYMLWSFMFSNTGMTLWLVLSVTGVYVWKIFLFLIVFFFPFFFIDCGTTTRAARAAARAAARVTARAAARIICTTTIRIIC